MLETGFHTFTRLTDDPEAVTGTIGRAAAGMGLRLIDADGRDVPPGAEGEIAADGPSVHLGYHKNPAANAELFTTGRLVPHRRPRAVRRGRQRADRRTPQGDDQPRRQEVLPARDRGDPLHAPQDAARRHRGRARPAARRAQLPLRDPAARGVAVAGGGRRLPRRATWRPTSCPRSWRSSRSFRSRRPARSSATSSCVRCSIGRRAPLALEARPGSPAPAPATLRGAANLSPDFSVQIGARVV